MPFTEKQLREIVREECAAAIEPTDDVIRAKLTRANEALREANRRLKKLGAESVDG